jgi:dynein heavy chain, axonemal
MPRVWLSIQRSFDYPSSLYGLCWITYVQVALSMKDALVKAFSLVDTDLLRHSSKPEWLPLLHNICYLHCALNLRTRFQQAGWDLPSLTHFTAVELMGAFQMLAREFTIVDQSNVRLESAQSTNALIPSNDSNTRQLSWSAIRYALADLIYGARALTEYDQRAIANIVDFWIQPASVRKDFEYTKIKLKIPSFFFTQQPKLNQLQQTVESLSPHHFDSPEACHLHSTTETNLGK